MALLIYSVPGHAGKLLFGLLEHNRRPVVLMVGRLQSVSSRISSLHQWIAHDVPNAAIMKATPCSILRSLFDF